MEERIRAILILGSYLDTIGFNNGMYEYIIRLSPNV